MQRLKQAVQATPLGPFAARIYRMIVPASTRAKFNQNIQYDLQTVEVMRRVLKPDSAALDIGAHRGDILKEMLVFAPKGRLFAFEPIPHLAKALRENFPTVDVKQLALSDAPGTSTFQYVVNAPAYSGLRPREYDRSDPVVEELTVQVETIDRVVPADVRVALMKLDIEGGELDAMRGGLETIKRGRPIIIFESGRRSPAYGTGPDDYLEFFDRIGYKLSTMRWWLAGKPPYAPTAFRENWAKGPEYYFIAYPVA
ncbi:MAG: FkbM family methyltransferase [Phycisphaerales bacterium]